MFPCRVGWTTRRSSWQLRNTSTALVVVAASITRIYFSRWEVEKTVELRVGLMWSQIKKSNGWHWSRSRFQICSWKRTAEKAYIILTSKYTKNKKYGLFTKSRKTGRAKLPEILGNDFFYSKKITYFSGLCLHAWSVL